MDGEDREWRYVYEALENVHRLRLLLFNPSVSPLHECVDYAASVHGTQASSLLCVWNAAGDGSAHRLLVHLPACLLDRSVPVRSWTRKDHVEVRLGLLSLDPFFHALKLTLDQESPRIPAEGEVCNSADAKPFSLNSGIERSVRMLGGPLTDAQALESNGGVLFFCRNCACKLTNSPFRRVLELPSADWREVAEHFYGTCCCASFGAHAESLVAKFQKLLTPSQEACLVASTTCIVHEDNVTGYKAGKEGLSKTGAAHPLCSDKNNSHPSAYVHLGCKDGIEVEAAHVATDDCEDQDQYCTGLSEATPRVGGDQFVEGEIDRDSDSGRWSSCCFKKDETGSLETKVIPESLGNGFMTGPGSQPEVSDWRPFFCYSCSSLVGATRGDSSKHGVQFFKCQISTDESLTSFGNVFRQHTLERVFTHELERNTESSSSYRYVVRSFRTGAALLQLVLLNQEASVCSGTCYTECPPDKSHSTCSNSYQDSAKGTAHVSLEAVARFMFCDCSTLDSEGLRSIDKWAQLQKADNIYMLEEVAEILLSLLKCHLLAYPPSCRSFEQFSVSYLRK